MPNHNPNNCAINRRIDYSCALLRWGLLILAIMQIVHSVVNARSSPFFINYYIPDEYYTLPVFMWCTFVHISLAVLTCAIFGLSSVFILSTAVHLNYIIANDIRCMLRQPYRTTDSLRTGHNLRITYRSLEILHNLQMEISGILLYPMNWLMMKMVIVCGVSFIKYHKYMSPLVKWMVCGWTVTGLISWGFALEECGYMFQYCQRAITSWKYHDWGKERKVMSKFRKSCRPMKVAYHKFFSIKRISVLKFFRSVAKSLFKAIVAL